MYNDSCIYLLNNITFILNIDILSKLYNFAKLKIYILCKVSVQRFIIEKLNCNLCILKQLFYICFGNSNWDNSEKNEKCWMS